MKLPTRQTSIGAFRLIVALLFLSVACLSSEAQSDTPAKRLERAAALIVDNKLAEAEQQLRYLLNVTPNNAAALDLLGTVRAKQGRLDDAEALFTRAVRADNRLIGAHMNLAYLHLLKGNPDKTALELKEVLRLDPNNADATYKLAWVLLSQARFDECIAFIENVKQSRPLSVPLVVVLGDAYQKKGDLDRAEKSYLEVLSAESNNADAMLGMSRVSRSRQNPTAALEYLNRAKELLTDSPELNYKFAIAATDLNLHEDAISALKKAIAVRPDEPSYYLVLGIVQLRLKRPDLENAEESFRQSLKRRPNNAQAQLHLGYVLLKKKSYAEAQGWLEKSIQKQNGPPEAFYYLGLIAQEQIENERAIELFQKAIQLDPTFGNAHIALGALYLRLKNYPRAREELEIGVKIDPDSAKGHYNLAILYSRLKDRERAEAERRIIEKLASKGKTVETEADPLSSTPPR